MDNIDFQEEVKKCMDSPAYFWNKYCKLVDKDGNELPKPTLTDDQVRRVIEKKSGFGRLKTKELL